MSSPLDYAWGHDHACGYRRGEPHVRVQRLVKEVLPMIALDCPVWIIGLDE
jgi:hypothetical protein